MFDHFPTSYIECQSLITNCTLSYQEYDTKLPSHQDSQDVLTYTAEKRACMNKSTL